MLAQSIFSVEFKFDWALMKKMAYYAFPIVIAGLAYVVNETLDRILLKQLLNNPDLVPETFLESPLR